MIHRSTTTKITGEIIAYDIKEAKIAVKISKESLQKIFSILPRKVKLIIDQA